MERKIELLNYQLIITGLFIISLIISIILTYDQKEYISNKKRIFKSDFSKYLNLFNRLFTLFIIFSILYINYEDYKLNKNTKKNIKPFEHQVIASLFSVVSAIIVLYVVIENWYESPNITSIENPTV
jgi:magnesium-transporting ATPase (P-type)